MKVILSKPADKQIRKLPQNLKKKVTKQFRMLKQNPHHPSLHVKKMAGLDCYEGRIDYKYRFTFDWREDVIEILSVGMHDVGLGKR